MPTPHFNFRLDRAKAKELHELARVYGAANTSVFLRDLISAIVSGDPAQVSAFNTKLFQKMGEQLALDFSAKAEASARITREALVTSGTSGMRGKRKPRTKRKPRNGRTT